MPETYSFFIVDDDRAMIKLLTRILKRDGHRVASSQDSVTALNHILAFKPDCILLDIMMPKQDGFELLHALRSEQTLDVTKIVMISSKPYDADREKAIAGGANDYIIKPFDQATLAERLVQIIGERMKLTFWGVHGTLPVPGPDTVRYGGNTPCVSLELPGNNLIVFDAGSGIKGLSDYLMKSGSALPNIFILISHPHWDHINALPFFAPLYQAGNEITIGGPPQSGLTIKEIIATPMDGVYFPINMTEFSAWISFVDIRDDEVEFAGVPVKTLLLNHPGKTLGYRIEVNGVSFCYVTDNELHPENTQHYNTEYREKLCRFIRDTDVLITDTTYTDSSYSGRVNWGHSSVNEVVRLAAEAGVRGLYLYHHDIEQTDTDIDAKLATAERIVEEKKSDMRCYAPREKESFSF